MKIITPGRVRDEWPVGVPLRCDRCGCEFQLERNDLLLNWRATPIIHSDRDGQMVMGGVPGMVGGTCPQPGCGNQCTILKETPRSGAYSAE